jgi:hypothetical protein
MMGGLRKLLKVLAGLFAFDGADRLRSTVAATAPASGGGRGSPPLIFATSQQTCICSVLSFDSLLEYPFACIAEGIFTKVDGLGLHAR